MATSDRTSVERSGLLDWEIEQHRIILRVLDDNLARRERELAALLDAVAAFERRYHQVLGERYARLAALATALAELRRASTLDRSAGDPDTDTDADASGTGPDETGDGDGGRHARRHRGSESAKRLFRRLARLVHPDLARTPEERERRTRLMMAANQAYADGDVERLHELLEDWEQGPDAVVGTGPEADLERLTRRIAQVRKRLDAIGRELGRVEASHMGSLYLQAKVAAGHGFDLLADMAVELDRVIERTQAELREAEREAREAEQRRAAEADAAGQMAPIGAQAALDTSWTTGGDTGAPWATDGHTDGVGHPPITG